MIRQILRDLLESEPAFWDDRLVSLPLYKNLIRNYLSIRSEILELIEDPSQLFDYPKTYLTSDHGTRRTPLYENTWKAIPFSLYSGEYISTTGVDSPSQHILKVVRNVRSKCKALVRVISDLESDGNLRNGFVSKLLPGSYIRPHRGRTNDFMRIHLGLECYPLCFIQAGEERRAWEDGKIIAFKDGGPHLHTVKHNGNKQRIIISVDVSLEYLCGKVESLAI